MAKKNVDVKSEAKKAKKAAKQAAEKVVDKVDKASKKADKRVKELQATVARLEGKVTRLEAKVEDWKGEAKKHQAKRAELKKALQDARRKPPGKVGPDTPVDAIPTVEAAEPVVAATPTAPTVSATPSVPVGASTSSVTPDATWTITRLRAAARERKVVGYSRKTKAELLEALS